jgi:hypothetical protein
VKDPTVRNPKHVIIKVTDNADRCYFVHFDRVSHDVVNVDEYKVIYRPWMTNMPVRTKSVIDAARTRLLTTPATETKETTSETEF